MNTEIAELLRSVIKEELSPINGRLERIENDITGLKRDVAGLKHDVGKLKQDISMLKHYVAAIKLEQQKTNERLTELENRQQIIFVWTGKLMEFQSETMLRFDTLATKKDLSYLDSIIARHDREIHDLKLRA